MSLFKISTAFSEKSFIQCLFLQILMSSEEWASSLSKFGVILTQGKLITMYSYMSLLIISSISVFISRSLL